MSTIVTRTGKGSPLTTAEMDANLNNLNNDKYQAGDNASFGTLSTTGTATLGGFLSTGAGTVPSAATSHVGAFISGTTPYLCMGNSGASANNRLLQIAVDVDGNFSFIRWNDAQTAGLVPIKVNGGQGSGLGTVDINAVLNLTSRGQIQFPAVANLSTNVNTLDDYEEQGACTITATCTTSGTVTLSPNTLSWAKVGGIVYINGYLAVTAVSSPTGRIQFSGLPFSNRAGTQYSGAISVTVDSTTGLTGVIVGRLDASNSHFELFEFVSNALSLTTANRFRVGTTVYVNFSYQTAG